MSEPKNMTVKQGGEAARHAVFERGDSVATGGESAPPCPCTARETAGPGAAQGILVVHQGNMRTLAMNARTGQRITVDGTMACGGAGEHLSPIDLFAAAYGSCVLMSTEMAARRQGLDLSEARMHVEITMAHGGPPSIERIDTTVLLPRGIGDAGAAALRKGALRCPIHNTVDPRVAQTLTVKTGSAAAMGQLRDGME